MEVDASLPSVCRASRLLGVLRSSTISLFCPHASAMQVHLSVTLLSLDVHLCFFSLSNDLSVLAYKCFLTCATRGQVYKVNMLMRKTPHSVRCRIYVHFSIMENAF